MKMIEVKDRFLKDDKKQAELELLLSCQDSEQNESGVIVYGGNMILKYSKNGKIKSIECHEESADRMERRIADSIYNDHGTAVGRRIIFTSRKISKCFRLDDNFQLVPVPPGSPEIGDLMGDHPAVLEFSYNKSSHHIVDNHRRDERADELANLLSAVVLNGVKWMNSYADFYWTADIPEGKILTAEFRQEYYQCGDWEQKDEFGFSVVDQNEEAPLTLLFVDFSQFRTGVTSKFDLAEAIGEYFRKFDSLPPKPKEMARLSAHWLQKASLVHNSSISLSFAAIVFALESLMPAPERKRDCAACGQAVYEKSVSERFKTLIAAHAKGVPTKTVNDVYSLRSTIAHGSGLMKHDQNVGFRFSDPLLKSRALYESARYVCQIVFINWLMSQDST